MYRQFHGVLGCSSMLTTTHRLYRSSPLISSLRDVLHRFPECPVLTWADLDKSAHRNEVKQCDSLLHALFYQQKSFSFMKEATEGALFLSQGLQKESPEDTLSKVAEMAQETAKQREGLKWKAVETGLLVRGLINGVLVGI